MAKMLEFTGRGQQLGDLVNKFKGLGRVGWKSSLNKLLGIKTLELTQDCFRNEKDPYGKAWAPITHRTGKIQRDTGRLMASIRSRAQGGVGFKTSTDVEYARQRNYGGTIKPKNARMLRFKIGNKTVVAKSVTQPARMFFPSESIGIPAAWMRQYAELANKFMGQNLGIKGRSR